MREHDAHLNGYIYCGPVLSSFPRDNELTHWQESLTIAKKIKKEYVGADYVIATGTKDSWLGSGSKGLFGNEVFNAVWNLIRYDEIDRIPQRIAKDKETAERVYQEALKDIAEREKDYKEKVAFLESIRKVK